MVSYLDTTTGRVVRIPASELRPGVIQARIQGIDGLVWICPDELHPSEIRHPPFEDEIRDAVLQIQQVFAEHRPLSFEEWEEGFRRDAHPEDEVALWLHAANVYAEFAANDGSAERRRDVYRIIVACLTTSSPGAVWHVLRTAVMSKDETAEVVRRFYDADAPADQ